MRIIMIAILLTAILLLALGTFVFLVRVHNNSSFPRQGMRVLSRSALAVTVIGIDDPSASLPLGFLGGDVFCRLHHNSRALVTGAARLRMWDV